MEKSISPLLKSKLKAVILASLIGDALAMPVHWFYDTRVIKKNFGYIKDYLPAPSSNPTGFMGRLTVQITSSDKSEQDIFVIGDVIMKGKQDLWVHGNHYHHGLKAGENTLSGQMMRLVLRTFASGAPYNESLFLENYVTLMTAEKQTFNDIFADEPHRHFFTNYAQGEKLLKCGNNIPHHDSVDLLSHVIPLIIRNFSLTYDRKSTVALAIRHVLLFAQTQHTTKLVNDFTNLLIDILEIKEGQDVRTPIIQAGQKFGVDLQKLKDDVDKNHEGKDQRVAGDLFAITCYVKGSWPIILYLAYKYLDPELAKGEGIEKGVTQALLQNVNLGGDSVNRGIVLGSIIGAAVATEKSLNIPTHFINGLLDKDQIIQEIEDFSPN